MSPLDPGVGREYEPLRSLMEQHGASCTPAEFYWRVNDAFHSAESSVYDRAHAGMFQGLEPMWRRLVRALPDPGPLRVLDVGSGTGLVGEYLARLVPARIASMTLLDPNADMLARSRERSRGWPFPVELVQGDVRAVAGRSFDVVTASSVLHHVVELRSFCASIAAAVRPGGAFLQIHDPTAEAVRDEVLARRRTEAIPRRRRRRTVGERLRRLAERLARPVVGRRPDPLHAGTNARLLERGVIRVPMSLDAIWAVTDFHVPGQPGDFGRGIAVDSLREWLAPLALADRFTYQFHGIPWDELSDADRERERRWLAEGDPHGAQLATAWRARAAAGP